LFSHLLSKTLKFKIYKARILLVILYGCLTLREENKLRVCENSVQMRVYGLMREEVVEGCRRLHNEELHKLYGSPNIIWRIKSRRMRWAEYVAYLGEM